MMTQDPPSPATPRWLRKLVIPGLIGAAAGFAGSAAMLGFIESSAVGGLGVSATIAALVGVLYAVIGLGLAAGLANPKAGARFLNVQDADDLREQRKTLSLSAATMVLWGVSLIALALAAPDGPVPQGAALVVGIGGLVIGTVISVQVNRACDELMRAVNLEAGAIGLALVQLVVGLWAVLAHLGLAAAPQPLDLLSLFYVLLLAASFIAVGRRGMLMTP
jgi:hypothetical protein